MNDLQGVTAAAEPPLARRLHAVGRKLGTPISGTFELTAGCNFNCEMCYIHDQNAAPCADGELTAAQWLEIGRQAADAGTVFLLLTGGEPLLRPDFAEIYTGLRKLGLMVSVNTNGSLLTGETARLFEENPPMRLNVSLYADSREGYRRQCGADAFDRVLANIRRMQDAGVEVKLNAAFTPQNADRSRELGDLIKELGLHCQASFYMYPPVRRDGDAKTFARLAPDRAAKLRVSWAQRRSGGADLLQTAKLLQAESAPECEAEDAPAEGIRCRAGHTAYWVNARGRMLMCGMIPLDCGNVLTEGFARCWQNTRALTRSVTMPKKCAVCGLRAVCCVCPAACFAETGDFGTAPPDLCEMSRGIAAELRRLTEERKHVETE